MITNHFMRGLSSIFLVLSATIFIVGLAVLTSGCELIEPAIYAKQGGMSPQREFSIFRRDADIEINRELAGEKPIGEPTWSRYWQWRYDLLRFNIARGYLDRQQYIDYLHQARKAANLPLYDNGRPPSEAYYKAHAYQ